MHALPVGVLSVARGQFARAVIDALSDIGDKLVQEGWFGRRPSERHDDAWNRWGLGDEHFVSRTSGQSVHDLDPSHWFAQEPSRDRKQSNEHEIDR